MLRQFHYIDPNGKDQGINVRNRASELVKLLGDVDMIRAERKKARANRHKFGGFEGGGGMGGGISGSRMQGFGSDNMTFGGYAGGVFGDGGGFGGASTDFQDTQPRSSRFEEYDEDEVEPITTTPAAVRRTANNAPAAARREAAKKPEPKKEPEPDLVDFGDDGDTTSTAAGKKPADDDDFDDFQSATTPSTQPSASQFAVPPPAAAPSTFTTGASSTIVAPQPVSASQGSNLNGIVGLTSPASSAFSSPLSGTPAAISQQPKPQQPSLSQLQKPLQQQTTTPPKSTEFQRAAPNYFTSVSASSFQTPSTTTAGGSVSSSSSFTAAAAPASSKSAAASKPGGDAFGSLWSAASAGAGIQKSSPNASKGPNLASMAKEKSSAGIWGVAQSQSSSTTPSASYSQMSTAAQNQPGSSSGLDDLLG